MVTSRPQLDGIYHFLYTAMPKDLSWVGRSLESIREFPDSARREAGHQLHIVQLGMEPSDWRPMPTVGPGVFEMRIHDQVEYRVLYVSKYPEAVYVLHAFQKATRKTAQHDIDTGRSRLGDLRRWRRDEGL